MDFSAAMVNKNKTFVLTLCDSIFHLGKDASLAFVTGDFTESGLTDDVSSLSPSQVMALYDWLAFYQKEYQAVGMGFVLCSI